VLRLILWIVLLGLAHPHLSSDHIWILKYFNVEISNDRQKLKRQALEAFLYSFPKNFVTT
jgi:hypothetical protein